MDNDTSSDLFLNNIEYDDKKFLNVSFSASYNKESLNDGSFLLVDITPTLATIESGEEHWETAFHLSVARAKQLREWLSFAIASIEFNSPP